MRSRSSSSKARANACERSGPSLNRRDNRAARCIRCRLHAALCMCVLLPRIETQTRLLLVVHRTEWQKPSNTGCLGAACLVNSEVIVRGTSPAKRLPGGPRKPLRNTEPEAPSLDREQTQVVILYPAADAVSLEHLAPELRADRRPVTLVVPDGNWRQASKVRQRVPWLQGVPCAVLPSAGPSHYRLRTESYPHGLATLEAIARAFGILESPDVQVALERVFAAMVERTLWARGQIAREAVASGVPEGSFRHRPRDV
jgi:DTW domain-containing protein